MIESKTTQNVAAGALTGSGGLVAVMVTVRQVWPDFNWWPVEADAAIIAVVTTVLIPMLSRSIAFLRDPAKVNRFRMLPFILAAGVGLSLSGCMGMAPAVMGKTHYNVEFVDQTAEQNTTYKMDVKAPAGVDLATVTGMSYDWKPDGSGAINVSQQGNVDSTEQAAMITEVGKQQLEAINMVLNALAPVLGQQLQSKDNRAAIEAQSEAEKMRAAIELIDQWNRQQANR